ncbi:MAG: cysteine desulfurase [Candidatus Pelagibacter sp. TMED64]|nr:cysteine desulfurase [Candidatus Pelagibacter sp.]OUU67582.1 MAG: cysteine desulfurase [Candidatus Pelagibacter sp. TMED64]|tara:strand:- start:2799 stop:4016 length:1218 start_codon:yes stop_codon:yes gene_type:complete
MNINKIKSHFPIFDNLVDGKRLVYLDSANSSQKPKIVIDKLTTFYEKEFSNVGRSVHSLAVNATNKFEQTRDMVKKYINASSREEIIFTKGATEAINLVATTYGQKFIEKGDEIIITELEHHSNYVPWHFLRETKGAVIKFANCNENGEVNIDEIKKLISNKTKMIAVTHLSNVTGAILPIKEIVDVAKEKKIPVLVDGCQSAPHLEIDMQEMGCDFYAISCHKMYGPTGLGILYAKKKWLENLPPYQGGGGMINEVKKDKVTFAEIPNKYEAGTLQTAQVVAFADSIKFLTEIGIKNIIDHEKQIMEYSLEQLRKNNSIKVIGNPKNRGAVISFTIKGIHPHDIATILDDDGVAIRAGHHCCQILHEKIGVAATARASLGVYNTKEDIDVLVKSIENCKKIFDI